MNRVLNKLTGRATRARDIKIKHLVNKKTKKPIIEVSKSGYVLTKYCVNGQYNVKTEVKESEQLTSGLQIEFNNSDNHGFWAGIRVARFPETMQNIHQGLLPDYHYCYDYLITMGLNNQFEISRIPSIENLLTKNK